MSGFPSLLRDSHEPDMRSTVTNTRDGNNGDDWVILLNVSSPTGWEGESLLPEFYPTTVLSHSPPPSGKELLSPWKPQKRKLFGWPTPILSKMDLHYPLQWAELWRLMAQHQWSEPGPHSSNVGIPIGGCPALCRRWMNKHTPDSIDFTLRSWRINMLSICLYCLVQWSQTIQRRIQESHAFAWLSTRF